MYYCPFCKKRLIFCGTDFDQEVNEYLCGNCNEEFEQDVILDELNKEFHSYGSPYMIDENGNEMEALSMVVDE